ncbi:MAG TPA: 6-phosphogluconolactonase [Kofleriaceae bacterium]|jgi:6-phosphogluconolactonase|nr:6-phosphogluconolactonase [Kofleriaceae bacterium]
MPWIFIVGGGTIARVKTHVGRLQVVDEAEELARVAATLIVEAARERPRCGIFLAGGATPRRTYEVVAQIANANDFAGVHLWLGDERAVPLEHADSNGGMILELWGDALGFVEDLGGGVRMPDPRLHVMPCGRGVEKQVKEIEWALASHAGTSPHPDLTLLGVGADGHTASLFPGDPALEANGLFASARGGARITATRRLLAASKRIVFLVAGDAKADIVASITADPHGSPAGRVALEAKAAGCDVMWLLDQRAVAKVS